MKVGTTSVTAINAGSNSVTKVYRGSTQIWSGVSAPVISGTAYPGETLTSTQAGQWYVNGNAVSGQTASTYVIRLNDIGYGINQTGSNTLTCWSPADISAVAGFWTPYRNVYNSTAPETAATNGQTVARWTDIKNAIQLNIGTAPDYNTAGTYPFLNFVGQEAMQFSDLGVFRNKAYGEIFFSGRITGIGSSTSIYNTLIAFANGTAAQNRLAIVTRSLGSNGLYARTHPLNNSTAKMTANNGLSLDTDYVINARAEWLNGGNLTISKDNAAGSSTTTDATANTPDTDSAYGGLSFRTGLTNSQTEGQFRCICLVNAALTATDRSKIARYMGLYIGKNITIV